jgi:alkylhydroperoxidase family enzyme
LSAHTVLGKGAGLNQDEIDAARIGNGATSRDAAIAGFARRATRQRGVITNAELDDVRRAGVTDGEVLEIVALIALNVLTNYTNHIAETEIDFPLVAARSVPQSDAA